MEDIVSDLEADPFGRFVLSVNSSSGSVSVIKDDDALMPFLPTVDLGVGPLHSIVTWPDVSDSLEVLAGQPVRAWVTAPPKGEIHELNLDALASAMEGDTAEGLLLRCASLRVESACEFRLEEGQNEGSPSVVALSPEGSQLFVGHAEQPPSQCLTWLAGPAADQSGRQRTCPDGLRDVLEPRDDRVARMVSITMETALRTEPMTAARM